ncbi:hypothetical protein E4U13_008383 [Claviceps humidiphila]|uniref:HMG box domain-containing protein n=1 Tax=Claviceps humidiphila TaxID=1294629 RepID=A0A9P7Q349_9HYPO|nr:hypothetical protein E4U13_008383 [Claviceps humidiphila]
MFSTVGRAAIGRASTRRVLLPNRPAASPGLATQFFCGPARTLSIAARLLSPAKAAVDEDGAPVTKKKRKSPAKKDPEAKKEAAAAKKEAAKKEAAVKKEVAKKLQAETKKKALEQIEELGDRVLYRELKEAALLKPDDLKLLPNSAFQVYLAECKAAGNSHDLKESWPIYHDLTIEEKERLAAIAQENKVANKKIKEEWILSQPAEVIYLANLARKRMAQIDSTSGEKKRCMIIHDSRQPDGLPTAVGAFIRQRYPDVKYDHNAGPDTIRALASEWRNLPEEQKAEFSELNKQERVKQSARLAEMKGKALQWIIKERKHWPNLVTDLFEKKS